MQSRFYSLQEVMTILEVSESTVLRWRNEKLMPQPTKIGRRILGWNSEKFDTWIQAL
jgi:predicted DNA-binding transcriptional regulator AlpA